MPSFEEIQIPVPWGHVSAKWWGPKDQQPIIAIHGWQDNAGTWDNLIPCFPEGSSILCIDLPGHGFSSHFPSGKFYYLFYDGLIVIRRIVKHYNWEKIIILGHSLGGAIGFLYAASFPEEIKALICIDIASPTIRDDKVLVSETGSAIDRFLKYENLTSENIPCYKKDEMIGIVFDAHKGSLTKETAEILMRRGMRPAKNKQGHYYFCRDIRLKVAGLGFLSLDLILEYAKRIKCPILNIKANPGYQWIHPELYYRVLEAVKQNSERVEFFELPGTHHIHLNDPESVSLHVNKFLKTL